MRCIIIMYMVLTNTDTNIILLCLLFFRSLFCFPKHTSVPRSQRNPLSQFTWFTICGIAESRIRWWPFVVWWRLSTYCKNHHVVFILQRMTQTWTPSVRWRDWWLCMYWETIVDRKEGLTLHHVCFPGRALNRLRKALAHISPRSYCAK